MEVRFYSFKKKDNSTARPSGGESKTVRLKADSSVINPTLEVATTEKPFKWNYCYIPEYDRYYWVMDWTWTVGFWEAALVVDVLASWRDTIGSTDMYVLRASGAYDGLIDDNMYPTKAAPEVSTIQIEPGLPDGTNSVWFRSNVPYADGTFVLGIVNASESTHGAVSYYAMSSNEVRALLNYLMEDTGYLDVPTDISVNGIPDNLLKTLYNPFQYIVSCKWFPVSPNNLTTVTSIPYGWWSIPVPAYKLSGNMKRFYGHVNIGYHPQALARGAYLNGAPYTRVNLFVQPFGLMPLDMSRAARFNQTNILIYIDIDFISGDGALRVYNAGGHLQTINSATVGVDIQLAQMAVDRLKQAETVITGAADVTRNTFSIKNALDPISGAASAVSSTAHAVADGIRSSFPQTHISGSNGSTAYTYAEQVATIERYILVDEDINHNGRPLCAMRKPSAIPGYILVRDADIATTGTQEEDTRLRAYLESGFYYE